MDTQINCLFQFGTHIAYVASKDAHGTITGLDDQGHVVAYVRELWAALQPELLLNSMALEIGDRAYCAIEHARTMPDQALRAAAQRALWIETVALMSIARSGKRAEEV